ncbi:cytochrome c, mono- and diheme variants family [Bernardetia litoralis DSM 6794]|uniref:Cytochrome c, mono-and diheme variants family n=1 Tax=Bernardetia litoralis (strain ATCC 23117 / DSM 6794 / NBRC 15988 / NCIMB 1366 / Fx l1 / Sio-4) TaxID=880071 RepID=I4AGM2_BERLS|nr:cbb3-type cytochrome c oxidase N-terminal domain-containing protein [Bernardetia litoralis]AFM03107.1 cytochrome c, mono- and diheme variants family [Bernardetia litoralis DSM 6794]
MKQKLYNILNIKHKKKAILSTLLFLLISQNSFALSLADPTQLSTDFTPLELGVVLLLAITFFVVVLVLMASISIYNHSRSVLKQDKIARGEEVEPDTESFSEWFWAKFNAAKPDKVVLMHHNYDGIEELDNDLPPWWKYGFYLCIVAAIIYFVVHIKGIAPNSTEEYEVAMVEGNTLKAQYLAEMASSINEENVELADAAGVTKGQALFAKKCKTCHGANAEGLSGPNLTDEYWLHGGDIKSVFTTVKYGVPAKGMISWKDQLSPQEMQQVASFVLSLQGSNPANGKEPQGEKYEAAKE